MEFSLSRSTKSLGVDAMVPRYSCDTFKSIKAYEMFVMLSSKLFNTEFDGQLSVHCSMNDQYPDFMEGSFAPSAK